ncbi:MAG: SMC-Scp complex subunit ScpB [Clostridia bacterium]
MELEKAKAIIEAILFACGREVNIKELMSALELGSEDIFAMIEMMKAEYERENRGIEIIKVNDNFQLITKKEYYAYIYPILDKRSKPNLSNAALETLSIIAYNPKMTRAEIESIRGVNSDGTIYKLLEYNLIEEVGRMDAPGRPTMYSVTPEFLRMFGFTSLEELPELPRYKLDENQQIVIDDLLEEKEEIQQEEANQIEAPSPEREDKESLEQEN